MSVVTNLNGRAERGDFMIDYAIDQTLDGANASAQVVVPTIGYEAVSLVEKFNQDAVHTLVATLGLEVSDNYRWENPSHPDTNWDPVTDPSVLAWLTTDAAASPPGGKPAGIAGTGSLNLPDWGFAAFRFTVTRTAGTGRYHLNVRLRGTGRR